MPDPPYVGDETQAPVDGVDGIPNFLHFPPAESEETRAQLERLNAIARDRDWKTALAEVYGAGSVLFRYVTDEQRAGFLDLLDLDRDHVVLEVGPGLGQFTPEIAKRVRTVYALEVVAGQALFTRERCRQSGAPNAELAIGGDDCRLPYGDASFDAVVLNLVFEWCATRDGDEPHDAGQRRMLAEAHRVLKPGGTLYLATKNRFGLGLLTGDRDGHVHLLPFGSALPRWCVALLLRLLGKGRPDGRIYSYRELRRLLDGAGFDVTRTYWATPEMRHPRQYVATDAASVRAARRAGGLVQGEMRRTRLLMRFVPAGWVKYVTPGLLFLARRSG